MTAADQDVFVPMAPTATASVKVGGRTATRISGTATDADDLASTASLDIDTASDTPLAYTSTDATSTAAATSTVSFSAWGRWCPSTRSQDRSRGRPSAHCRFRVATAPDRTRRAEDPGAHDDPLEAVAIQSLSDNSIHPDRVGWTHGRVSSPTPMPSIQTSLLTAVPA
jgi:hypothetical protein